ncbi:Ribonuclease H [Abeliophyllum distichum]|uniref:Ribonuclease H n=1 Tax=Abeliophyllum distichum TaxID=126358 RepID=A0ABD1QWZ1_9LAMI
MARTRRAQNATAPPAPVGDADTESNAATNHPQQEFASAAQLTALQAQVAALASLLQNRNATVSQPPQGPSPLQVEPSPLDVPSQDPNPAPLRPSPPEAPLQVHNLLPRETPPEAPPLAHNFPTMGTSPTTAPPLVPISFPPSSAPHLNSLVSGPNTLWGQPSGVPTPTLAETPGLSLEQRLEDMMGRKIAEAMSKKNSRQQSMVLEEDPFSIEVMAVPLPRDFEQPKMEKYDGSSDPVDHLRAFVDLMRLRATPDAIMCRAFPPTLRHEARDWVATLPPKSIRTFDDFSKKFAAYFASSKRAKKTAIGLLQLTQDKDELLKDFIARFNRATLGIKDLQMSAVVTAMMNGTRSHPFKMSLSKNPPDTMHELLRRGDKYVDAEEAFFITKGMKDRKEPESNKRKDQDEPRLREDRGKQKMIHPGPNRPSTEKEAHSTPLLTSRANILMEIQNMKELVWPKKMWAPPHRRDETKYSKFHRDHGHDTEDCQQLKEEIERLIKRGQLSKFVKADKEKGKEAEYRQQPPPRAGVINVIVGGIAAGGDSNSARKSYARGNRSTSVGKNERFSQNITFNDEDLEGMTCPHDDALVIVADIADFDVKRVLVDNGSAADVMSWEVFLGLKISPSKIKPVTTPLHGFGGATVIPEGTIELPVTLGTYPASVIIMTSFILVKAPMAYNAIYGRPLLNAARAVVSTHHQVMKFPTSRGVGCVRGDQQVSRRCYVDSISIKNTVMMLDLERPNGRIEPSELTEDVIIAKDQVLKIMPPSTGAGEI